MPKLKPGDRMVIAVVLIACIAGAAWFGVRALSNANTNQSGLVVVCQTRDGFRRVDALDADVTYTVDVNGGASDEEGYNIVTIQNGSAAVLEADCSNQVCVEHASISQVGEQIVCLPHGLVVEVVADEADASTLL